MVIKLDDIDIDVLDRLQHDGRITNQRLADEVGLSPSACLRRVQRLEECGVITGYAAQLDASLLGFTHTIVVHLSLERQRQVDLDEFERAVRECPGILSCHLMSGDADYLISILSRGMEDYERLHREHLAQLPGVARMRSSVVIRSVLTNGSVDLSLVSRTRRQ